MSDETDGPRPGAWPRHPFPLGSRVKGPGVTGEVANHPGPYSCEIRPDKRRELISISNSQLEIEP